MQNANNETLCLPGHQRPFYGALNRLKQIDENIQRTLQRLHSIANQTIAAIECVEQVYGRTLASDESEYCCQKWSVCSTIYTFEGKLIER